MIDSRDQRVTRRPPAVLADGGMGCSVRYVPRGWPLMSAASTRSTRTPAVQHVAGIRSWVAERLAIGKGQGTASRRGRPAAKRVRTLRSSSAMSDAPTQLAPGVHRLGNAYVNCYLIEDGNHMTLVDGGLPGFRGQLDDYLRSRGTGLSAIDAVILTHAHGDHVGMAEGVRLHAGASVHVHADDADMARTGKVHKRAGSLIPHLRRPATWKLLAVALRNGAAKTPKLTEVTTFTDGDLDVPGRPRVIPTPGHSPGHVAFHFPDRGLLIAGDALCTYNVLTGRRGPQLMPNAFAWNAERMLASLEAIERVDAGLMVFGHGEPWTDGPAAAVARAREVGFTLSGAQPGAPRPPPIPGS